MTCSAPNDTAAWTLVVVQIVFFLVGAVSLMFASLSAWRSGRRMKEREADLDRQRAEIHQRMLAHFPLPSDRRADA